MLRMDQVHVIRHKVLIEGQSIRRVAREMGLSRLTVRKYLESSEPVRRGYRSRARPVWEQVRTRVEELVAEWEPRTTAKQRLTGVRLASCAEGRRAAGLADHDSRIPARASAPASGSLCAAGPSGGRGGAGRLL